MTYRELCEEKKIVKSFFPSGTMYSSSVYENEKLIRCSKYFSNGKLAQIVEYSKGKITVKEIYNRDGELAESFAYHYDSDNLIEKIVNEKINTVFTVSFERDGYAKRIKRIYVKRNNLILRKLEYEYYENQIICYDTTSNEKLSYKIPTPPAEDERWLNVEPANSLVMRKLRSAFELCA